MNMQCMMQKIENFWVIFNLIVHCNSLCFSTYKRRIFKTLRLQCFILSRSTYLRNIHNTSYVKWREKNHHVGHNRHKTTKNYLIISHKTMIQSMNRKVERVDEEKWTKSRSYSFVIICGKKNNFFNLTIRAHHAVSLPFIRNYLRNWESFPFSVILSWAKRKKFFILQCNLTLALPLPHTAATHLPMFWRHS